nr:arylsulfatase [Haloferula luteola]
MLVILADDLGWSDLGCYGGEIETPVLDSLAAKGVRFRQFYNGARCCPSRAALLTGLYPHQAGMGGMVDSGDGSPGPYQGYLNDRCVTLAEVLKPVGYRTLLAGKWHVGEQRPNWPIDRGFDHSYGLISGAMNYFDIRKGKTPNTHRIFAEDDREIQPVAHPDYYVTDDFTDHALAMLRATPDHQPFFLYLAYTAPHWPLHAPEALIQKYLPRYAQGWDPIRQARHQRLLDLGLLPPNTPLPPGEVSSWNDLEESQRKQMSRKLATHAAMVERMDQNIGRVLDELHRSGRLENTLILFLSDNGASAEEGPLGKNFRPDLTGPIGSVDSYQSFGRSGAATANTPLRKFKKFTEEGGCRTPLIISWPLTLRHQSGHGTDAVGHVIDIMPTLCEAAGASYPKTLQGRPIQALEGQSLIPILKGEAGTDRHLGWEHLGHAAWRQGSLKVVRDQATAPWELYDLANDPLELHNLAPERPETVKDMDAEWTAWATRIGVR